MFKYHMFCSGNDRAENVKEYVIKSGYAIKDAIRAFTYQMANEIKKRTIIYEISFGINPVNNYYTGYICCSDGTFATWGRSCDKFDEAFFENGISKDYAALAKKFNGEKVFYEDIIEKLDDINEPNPRQFVCRT